MVTQMSIPEKISALQECVSKCEDLSYAVNAKLGDNKEETLKEIRTIITNARTLFLSGQIENLDYDMRQEAFRKWHNVLGSKLALFPEYQVELEAAPRMHM